MLDLGSPVLGGALAGLGFGVKEVGRCIRAALGLVCLAQFERSRSLGLGWPGIRLGWGGIAGVWHVSLLCCWSDDCASFWDT